MPENNDTNAEAVNNGTPAGETGSAASTKGPGSQNEGPTPIFESFIYEIVKTNTGLGGDTGKPGTLGGAIGGQEPKYRVLTYPFIPPQVPDIEKT